jgi:predicted ATPase/DNA-binding CsgD family transcriptional regulator
VPRPTQRSGNLPDEATSFVGRRRELAEVRKKLTAARLVCLVGPGGVGKTRIAIRIATDLGRGFPGGVWLVELAELQDPALVSNAVMAAVDLRDQAATEPLALLLSYLKDKELLLVLDSCEHVLEAAAQLVSEVIRAAPGVRVIATSREPLSVAGEHVLPIPPLELPSPHAAEPLAQLRQNEAVMLFIEGAAAASGSFELTASNQAAVVDLCRRLDGLPLAIELAAVRTRVLSPEQIRDRLSDRFGLLTGGSRAALPRHQTLRTTIEWSYDLMAPAERTLLTRLCVFAGRFTLDDVESVCCSGDVPAARALDLLSSLVNKSLVIKEDAAGAACYRLHEAGEENAVERRCADYYLSRCLHFAAEGRTGCSSGSLGWSSRSTTSEPSSGDAWTSRTSSAASISRPCLTWYWITRATTEGVRWLDELLSRDARPVAYPWAYFARGFLAVLQSDPAAGMPALERTVTAARAGGQLDALSQSLAMASIAANMAGDRASSLRLLDEARLVADGLDDLGATLMLHQARALNASSTAISTPSDPWPRRARGSARGGRPVQPRHDVDEPGLAALMSGDLHESEQRFTEGLRIAHQLDDRVAQCYYLLGGLGCCAAGSGDPRLAAQLFGAMENLRAEVGASIIAGMAPALAHGTASVRAALSPSRFETEFKAGQQLSRDAAARRALREAAPPAVAASEHRSAGGLGQREADIARLVADGLSNKEIGVRLFISERTVESHVRNILNKLGFNSRAQIAGWMGTSDR